MRVWFIFWLAEVKKQQNEAKIILLYAIDVHITLKLITYNISGDIRRKSNTFIINLIWNPDQNVNIHCENGGHRTLYIIMLIWFGWKSIILYSLCGWLKLEMNMNTSIHSMSQYKNHKRQLKMKWWCLNSQLERLQLTILFEISHKQHTKCNK